MGTITLLTGTFVRTLDEKLRLAVPKPLREALEGQLERPFFVTPGTDGSLALYPERAFDHLAARLAELSPGAAPARDYSRLFYSQAARLELDRNGRFRLPQSLADFADMRREVVLLGIHDHMEIWSQARWEEYLADRRERYDELAEAALAPPHLPLAVAQPAAHTPTKQPR